MKLKVKKIGGSTGLVLPEDLLVALGLKPGDELTATTLGNGGLLLAPRDPDLTRSMAIVDELMGDYRHTLKELAG